VGDVTVGQARVTYVLNDISERVLIFNSLRQIAVGRHLVTLCTITGAYRIENYRDLCRYLFCGVKQTGKVTSGGT
jgi:hypothetical protein